MTYLKSIEPAAITGFIGTLFPLAILLFNLDLPPDAEAATLTAIPIVIGAAQAALVRPVKVPVMVNGVTAILTALVAWEVPIDPELVPLVSAALLSLGGLLTSARVSPNDGVVDLEVVSVTTH